MVAECAGWEFQFTERDNCFKTDIANGFQRNAQVSYAATFRKDKSVYIQKLKIKVNDFNSI